MPRTSKEPCYYKSKKAWYANLDGERILLVRGEKKKTEVEAKEKYTAEVEARKVEVAGDRGTVWAVLNAYLRDCQNRVKNEEMAEGTCKMHTDAIVPFNAEYGEVRVRDLRVQHVNDFIARMRQPRWNESLKREVKWGAATAKLCRDVLKRVFNWAAEEAGLIGKSPFDRAGRGKRAKRQRQRPAGTRVAILPGEHDLLLEQAMRRSKKDFAHLLLFLRATGARPAEMYLATADEWSEEKRAFVIKAVPQNRGRYKLAHLGEDRTVYVPAAIVPLVKELMAKYPTGPLFRTENGKPWKNSTLCARFKSIKRAANRAAEKKGGAAVRKEVTAYAYRHAFVTRWVTEGRHLWKLCELLNTSEAMVRKSYSHLFEDTETLRGSLDEFDQGRAALPATSADLVQAALDGSESTGLAS